MVDARPSRERIPPYVFAGRPLDPEVCGEDLVTALDLYLPIPTVGALAALPIERLDTIVGLSRLARRQLERYVMSARLRVGSGDRPAPIAEALIDRRQRLRALGSRLPAGARQALERVGIRRVGTLAAMPFPVLRRLPGLESADLRAITGLLQTFGGPPISLDGVRAALAGRWPVADRLYGLTGSPPESPATIGASRGLSAGRVLREAGPSALLGRPEMTQLRQAIRLALAPAGFAGVAVAGRRLAEHLPPGADGISPAGFARLAGALMRPSTEDPSEVGVIAIAEWNPEHIGALWQAHASGTPPDTLAERAARAGHVGLRGAELVGALSSLPGPAALAGLPASLTGETNDQISALSQRPRAVSAAPLSVPPVAIEPAVPEPRPRRRSGPPRRVAGALPLIVAPPPTAVERARLRRAVRQAEARRSALRERRSSAPGLGEAD